MGEEKKGEAWAEVAELKGTSRVAVAPGLAVPTGAAGVLPGLRDDRRARRRGNLRSRCVAARPPRSGVGGSARSSGELEALSALPPTLRHADRAGVRGQRQQDRRGSGAGRRGAGQPAAHLRHAPGHRYVRGLSASPVGERLVPGGVLFLFCFLIG